MQIYTSWTQNRLNSSGWKLLSFKHRTFYWKKAGGKHSQFSKWRKMFRNISSGSHTFKIFVHLSILFAAKSLQPCLTLCDPIESSSPGSPVPGILQARTLEWVAIYFSNAAKVKSESEVVQSCPTFSDPMDCSPPGSPVPGILHARTLEWVPSSFSNAWKVKVKSFSCVWLLATPWIAAYQAPPSMGFSRQKYWGGFPLPLGSYYSICLF